MDASQMTCPKCGWVRELGAVECPACGIVYARYGGGPRPTASAEADPFAPPPLPPPPNDALNPYAPPQSIPQTAMESPFGQMYPGGAGVWRAGDILVMQKGASLPNRCLVCNQPASVQFPKKMYWHHPAVYLLILINIIVYAIGAAIVRKKADVVLPLCAEHAAKRKRMVAAGWLVMLGGFALMLGSCTQASTNDDAFVLLLSLGFLVLLAGLIVFSIGSNLIAAKKIDDYHVWLRKVSASYLAALPPAPPGL